MAPKSAAAPARNMKKDGLEKTRKRLLAKREERYKEVGSEREITYIEEKGALCATSSHVRNQPVSAHRVAHGFTPAATVRA